MSLEQQIQEAIKEAMKAKDAVALSANRAIKGEILCIIGGIEVV